MAGRCYLITGPYQARTYIDSLREYNRYFNFTNAHTFVSATLGKSLSWNCLVDISDEGDLIRWDFKYEFGFKMDLLHTTT